MPRLQDLDLKLLRVFRTVAECEGFVGAQAVLNISQSTISGHIKTLEERLGFSLCRRGRAGFYLTDEGQALFERSLTLFTELESFDVDIQQLRGRLAGTLRVGLVDNTITNDDFPLHLAIEGFCAKAPDVKLELEIEGPQALQTRLLKREIQVLLAPFSNRLESLNYQKLREETHRLYCGASHPFFEQSDETLHPADIATALFAARKYLTGQDIAAVGAKRAAAFVSNMEAQAILIRSGRFIGFLPEHYVQAWGKNDPFREIVHPGSPMTSTFFIVTRKNDPQPAILRAFIKELQATLC
ncbi:LysR family transcriptional regulator [Pelagibius sp. Alg239-R121]|uniref:LysR family transcriptional regulator n=1 Tax=Pelagibius sp. Alg239-R121 TaxID=2993448 RepID=UPI0024A70995|nr:LysR family transcriptional regulator [Pelagibius sp. Alg239-R121]